MSWHFGYNNNPLFKRDSKPHGFRHRTAQMKYFASNKFAWKFASSKKRFWLQK